MVVPRLRFWLVGLLALVPAGAASAGDGLVALQTAQAACPDDSGERYVDCHNGTVTDNLTGLVWLANADCFGAITWIEAMAAVAGLADLPEDACPIGYDCDCDLSDGSSPGEWRLPTMSELEAMLFHDDCYPRLSTDSGADCWFPGCDILCFPSCLCSFYGLQYTFNDLTFYWSSSTAVHQSPDLAWVTSFGQGGTFEQMKNMTGHVWPVRGGQ